MTRGSGAERPPARRPRRGAESVNFIEPPDDAAPENGGGVRLQKVMAAAGVGSRRLCEQLIEQGRVQVNKRVVNRLPAWVDPATDVISVEGQVLPLAERQLYVMYYKPRHMVSTLSDPEGRKTVADGVQHPSGARLYPVGRLDYDTMGLLLLTNDGELANRLTHPRYGVHKSYRALVRGGLTEDSVAELEKSISLAERKAGRLAGAARTGGVKLSLIKAAKDRSVIEITLSEGRNRQVRLMLGKAGCLVKKLVHVRMGPLSLRGVAMGKWRELTREELKALRVAVGLAKAPAKKESKSRGPARTDVGVNLILPTGAGSGAARIDEDDELAGDGVW